MGETRVGIDFGAVSGTRSVGAALAAIALVGGSIAAKAAPTGRSVKLAASGQEHLVDGIVAFVCIRVTEVIEVPVKALEFVIGYLYAGQDASVI